MNDITSVSRRTAMKTIGAGIAGATLLSGVASAHGGTGEGDAEQLGGGSAHAYVEYSRGRGRLSALGVHLDGVHFDQLNDVPAGWPFPGVPEGVPYTEAYHLEYPRGNTGHFSYVGLDWNPAGHEPAGLYTDPHFDVHFYLPSTSEIASIPPGAPNYEIPSELMPGATGYTPVRSVVPGMGEHLFTVPSGPNSAHSVPDGEDWSVFIWGAYDLDGDGSGNVIFMEPMVTTAYLEGLSDGEVRRDIAMPERFLDGGWYPTEFVVRRESDDFDIALESFEQFAGYDG